MLEAASTAVLQCNTDQMMAMSPPDPKGLRQEATGNGHDPKKTGFWALTLGSIGVVYGDIGTSPIYAFREAMRAASRRRWRHVGDGWSSASCR